MSAILLVGLSEDAERCRPIAHALFGLGADFLWLSEGPSLGAAADARCVVLVWTAEAASDRDFLDFAGRMHREGKAIGGRLEQVSLPDNLAGLAMFDLTGFQGDKNDVRLLELLDSARAKVRGIAPAPPQSFFGRFKRRTLIMYAIAIAPVLAVIGNLNNVVGVAAWFNGPSAAETKALAQTDKRSCKGLKAFRDAFPHGYYAERVTRAIDHPEHVGVPADVSRIYPQLITVTAADAAAAPDRDTAMREAMARADTQARRTCLPSAKLDKGRLQRVGIQPRAETVDCHRFHGGLVCGFVADVECEVAARVDKPEERCSFVP